MTGPALHALVDTHARTHAVPRTHARTHARIQTHAFHVLRKGSAEVRTFSERMREASEGFRQQASFKYTQLSSARGRVVWLVSALNQSSSWTISPS